ncbi:hypothetical protein R1sor_020181 [Riccia sorocarpa]|uniref:Homeobox domain-containing protein n=1 Tax=Riccia sorocarpa TaxID=122646 RepID=A0ABD3IGA1_9MARC
METASRYDDGASPAQRKTISRRKKSAAQIELLERVYSENKYPSEMVRAKLSAQLGLSEKQMQVWFTHRRHKDRKDGVDDVKLTFYAMRHKGGEAHLDYMEELNNGKRAGRAFIPREDMSAPSGGYRPQSFPGGKIINGHYTTDRRMEEVERTDSDDSEGSEIEEAQEPSYNAYLPPAKRSCSVTRKDQGVYKRPQAVVPHGKPSARDLELTAIAAVEAKLGGRIRADGPLLGLEFDLLPPDAGSSIRTEQVLKDELVDSKIIFVVFS